MSSSDAPQLGVVLAAVSAQLEDTARHIEESVARVCTSFAGIARQSKEGAARAARAAVTGNAQTTARTTIAALLSRMDHVQRAADEAVATLHRLEGITSRVNNIQQTLVNVDAVAYALRILALNARIEAAHTGLKGKGFEVVASETGRQAELVAAAAKSVRVMVDELWQEVREGTQRMRGALVHGGTASDLRRAAGESREEGARALDALERAQEEMQAEVRAAADGAGRLAENIEDAMTALQFQDAVNQQLAHAAAALGEVRNVLATGDLDQTGALLDQLRARATMQSERRILDQLDQQAQATTCDSAPGSVELF
ncbi:MAG TPA: methyl-accepting chemotaxis protein [Gemmata sp.]